MTFTNPYQAFVFLAQLDFQIAAIGRNQEKGRQHLNALQAELDALKSMVALEHKKFLDERRTISDLEHTVSQLRIRKDRLLVQRDRAISARERQVLEADAASMDDQIDRDESRALELLELLELHRKELDANKIIFDKKLANVHDQISAAEQLLLALDHEYKDAFQRRPAMLDGLEESLRVRYTSFYERDPVPAVVVVENRCGGCHTLLTAADLLAVRRHAVITCSECYKLLYTSV